MLFTSLSFFVFFPITCIIYFALPWNKLRNIWLLAASCFFYMNWNVKYTLLLYGITAFSYAWALLISKCNLYKDSEKKMSKGILAVGVSVPLLILFTFKYAEFLINSLGQVISCFSSKSFNVTVNLLLPLGISFYIFQNISYIVDVYRKDVEVETDFLQYALYISFFPQLVAGPIELSKVFLVQFKEKHLFDYDRVKRGIMLMLWGYFLKLVIADRVGIFVDAVFANTAVYSGRYQLAASLLFPIQIYTDFYGYSSIARGAGEVMGFSLTDNFNAPFLSESFADLWRRWHVSLYNWFRNYVYYPLGGNRKGTVRKFINLAIVCALSGLWHGDNWTYVIWGLLLGVFQIIEALVIGKKESSNAVISVCRKVITYMLFAFCFVFFRATSVRSALLVFQSVYTSFGKACDGNMLTCGISIKAYIALLLAVLILLVCDICKVKKISVRDYILTKNICLQWAVLWAGLLAVVILGIYGNNNSAFIYFVF